MFFFNRNCFSSINNTLRKINLKRNVLLLFLKRRKTPYLRNELNKDIRLEIYNNFVRP